MIDSLILKLILSNSKPNETIEIVVAGISMYPSIYNGDKIQIQKSKTYAIGDIIIFTYKGDELLVHRLLRVKNKTYFCKGDNAFRLEDINEDQILGKVVSVNGIVPLPWTKEMIDLSYQVNREYIKTRDTEKTKHTSAFLQYQKALSLYYDHL